MRFLLLVLLALPTMLSAKTDFSVRASAFGSLGWLPATDVLRARTGRYFSDESLDVRSLFEVSHSGWEFAVHHQLMYRHGDLLSQRDSEADSLNSLPGGDESRALDLSWSVHSGASQSLWHRFDRLSVGWSNRRWRIRLGRQASSWGNGLIFQPADALNPFSPVAVDTEFKPGDDMLLVEHRFASGQDVQAIAVARRDANSDLRGASGSYGVKWHTPVGESDLELFFMRHYADEVFGAGFAQPVGDLLLRADVIVTRSEAGAHRVSAVINSDATFVWGETQANLLVEYFLNGFGEDAPRLDSLRQGLRDRLRRGELANVGKQYLACSLRLTPDLRWNYGGLLLANLDDGSVLAQMGIALLPSDYSSIDLGVTFGVGRDSGDEYRGLHVSNDPGLEELTSGGGGRLYLRLARYF